MAGAAEERVVRTRRVAAAVTFIFAFGKERLLVEKKGNKEMGNGGLVVGNCCVLVLRMLMRRKLYRGRRDACTYMRPTSGRPYALTAIFAWKERRSLSPVSIGVELQAGRTAMAELE